MAKKKKKNKRPYPSFEDYDATAPDAVCIFCSTEARYTVEYECGILQHRHAQVATCKSCTWLLSQTTGGQFTIRTKAFDDREELAQMKVDALNAVQQMLEEHRLKGDGHANEHLKKTPPRIERDFWHG